MDDPWGSPWTTADADPTLQRTPSPTKSELEPPPRALLSSNPSPRLPPSASASPWADDDDGFGDWASANTPTEATQAAASPWAGWGGPDLNTSREQLSTRSRDGSFTTETPIAWPGNIALSPGPKPASGSILRQLSPDPWASEFAPEAPHSPQHIPRLVVAEPPESPTPIYDAKIDRTGERRPDSIWDDKADDAVDWSKDTSGGTTSLGGIPSDSHQTAGTETPPTGVSDGCVAPRTRSIRSRSSSASGDNSDHDTGRQDSPITSVDEDSKTRPQPTPRKASGKVQDLVVKFDSLAKAALDEPAPTRQDGETRSTKADPNTGDSQREAAEFGDFEDGDDAASPWQASRISSPERTPTPRSPDDRATWSSSPSPRDHTPTSPRLNHIDIEKKPIVPSSHVKFDVALDKVASLFSGGELSEEELQNIADMSIPDRPITDSFADISERKAWYRVSRQGSSRMHNAGDDDNYCRIAWPPSNMRQETLTIVRRWMEEDSITGRATLGGGPSRRDMFGWDSAAEPVSLDKVFGKQRGRTPPKAAPTQHPLPAAPVPTGEPPNISASRQKSDTIAPDPFGWNSAAAVNVPTALASNPLAHAPQKPQPQAGQLRTPQTLPQPPNNNRAIPSVEVAIPQPLAEEIDDEWGDMVSSPQDEAKPAASVGFGDLDAVFSQQIQPSADRSKPVSAPRPLPKPTQDPASNLESRGMAGLSFFDPQPKPPATATNISDDTLMTRSKIGGISNIGNTKCSTDLQNAKGLLYKKDLVESDDVLVRRVLDGLPDLSYMLR